MLPVSGAAKRSELSSYERGWIDGLAAFCWFRDGTRWVGTTGTTFQEAVVSFLTERGFDAETAARVAHAS